MRLLIKLKSLQDAAYDLYYYKKISGFIYSLLKNTPLENLHDSKNPKFFCFSNIFPVGDLKVGDERYLLISSPDRILIELLKYKMEKLSTVKFGELLFKIEEIKTIQTKLNSKKINLRTSTPIIIRIPPKNYELYGIENKNKIEYWKPQYPFEIFVKQLEDNIFKKYKKFYNQNGLNEFPIFERLKLVKTVRACFQADENKDVFLLGTLWEFEFENLSKEKKEILEFALDYGFGEKNSY
ncbi:MAG: CRISPR-associated endoribonuclease Cas6, partial [Candidatus Micrarchaeota archaeon]|nr:CRISPR-associated endoribonuclease Cas6 [Candidatus Micrarchaeota archaeon]